MTFKLEEDLPTSELDRRLHASVLKREAWKEKEWREAKEARDAETMLGFGGTDMTKVELKKLIDSDRRLYYRTEELNDKLYIQYKGWKTLQNLEGWTGLKAMYAECNAFERIQGLMMCRSLRSLFLQENCIKRIEGLEGCPELWSLNLSNNFIERIEGLSTLKKLNTLVIAKNKIGFGGVEDVAELLECPSLGTVDIQDNKIWDPDVLPEVFSRMTDLRVLYMKGNPCCKGIPNYRKSTTVYCPDLRYLDDRPVFPDDRRAAEAFNRGGLEEERAERRRIRQEASEKHDRNMRAFSEMVASAKREKRERDAMRAEDKFTDETDPVESMERRMRRQVEQWKEDNAEDLKDDAREYAERCLKAEKEARKDSTGDASLDESPAPPDLPAQEAEAEAAQAPEEDKRTLVYEDIWDDVPLSSSASRQAAADTSGRTEGRAAELSAPAAGASTEGVFMPWATGNGVVGMEAVHMARQAADRCRADGAELLAAHEAELARAAEAASEDPAAGSRPGWYSKFAEKVQTGAPSSAEGRREDGSSQQRAPAEAKPPAVEAAAAPSDAAELDEMD